ncbi:hypothetical protein SPF06_18570 [Sinomonas sp. JGH33]|uniref:DUF222 domain-containing protein n=1 Tax=Sinomonas terricola TaxID=3110330 RepID=A0ABU5TB32_9MICC|nr:hypothetical protein [Sinomonas sp. JGH33]MEA5456732.1 hypothetical protein [Sinomonas sp. JGH33]
MSHDEELRWVRRREGTHRPGSRETPGYDRDLLREDDTENLLGPTESRPADIDEIVRSHAPAVPPRPTAAQELRYQLGDAIMDALRPHIERGVDVAVDTAVLGVSKLWKWATSKSGQRKGEEGDENESQPASVPLGALHAESTTDIVDETDALAVRMPSMTAEQYQAILLSALLADQYAAHLRLVLSNVRVRDDVLPAGLESAIQAALEGPVSSIDKATLASVVELLGGSRTVDGEFMLVRTLDPDARQIIDEQP